jgi:hypothetical protein
MIVKIQKLKKLLPAFNAFFEVKRFHLLIKNLHIIFSYFVPLKTDYSKSGPMDQIC